MSFIHDDLCVGQESHRKLCLPMSPLSLLSLCTERAEYCLAFPALFYYASCTLSIERKERHAHTHTQRQKKTDRQTVKTERQSVRRIDSQTDRFKNTRKHARTNTHTHMHTRTHIHIHIHAHTQKHSHTRTHTHTCKTPTHIHAHTCTNAHTHTNTNTHTHMYTHTHTHPCQKRPCVVKKRGGTWKRDLICKEESWHAEKRLDI